MSKLRSHLACLVDQTTTEDTKLKAAQEVSENLETIVSSQHYPNFLETAIPIFLQLLREGEPHFIADSCGQQLRKLVLELIHRLPTNDHLKGHVKAILSTMFYLLEIENEENVLVCLRIIIEQHKQFRPSLSPEISRFLQFVKTIYADLPKTMTSLLEPGEGGSVEDASKTATNSLPKAATSLKVLAELPIIVVLMYQLYKATVHNTVIEFIPLTMNAITLQPSTKARQAASFNKEIYVDFVAVQIKFLSFLAYIIRIYQEQVSNYAGNMVQGMLILLKNCPQEVAHLRRELLIAARHILATDMRNRFVSVIDQLLDENILIGGGWTTRDTVRPLAYSILADLVHHIRSYLNLSNLSVAVHVFSRNVHDDTLPVSIQTMSCKLLLNLVESIRIKAEQEASARDILMRMMKVFIIKFKSIAEYEIPDIFQRCQNPSDAMDSHSTDASGAGGGGVAGAVDVPKSADKRLGLPSSGSSSSISSTSTSQPASAPLSVADCRGIVKTLVCGMKTITWGAGSCKMPGSTIDYSSQNPKTFLPHETRYFIDLFRYGLIALDIYRVTAHASGVYILRSSNCQTVKTREEKEVLEHFAGVFTMMTVGMYKEIFKEMIGYLVDRIESNYALQIVPNSFLANPTTSPAFAAILLKFLLSRMEKMGENMERSNLYLKLFKLVFGSVTIFAQENELMLKPHLHQIVLQSMSLANTAPEPCNYFLLLRALFRSIGGGSHEQLYQEFLPLLSNLLQGLNRLQSGHHKQYMKDLFVELCLTVPVRLSSLLPYLHMLMDPLVSALSGSQTLISQGLRTLELCVDNLQPDFLYDHIQPVRAELMQALWLTLHNPDDSVAGVAYRVLGKFGGSNRKMISTPQPLEYRDTLRGGAVLLLQFQGVEKSVELLVGGAAEAAVKILKAPHSSVELFYKQHAWLTIQSLLVSMLNLGDTEIDLHQLLKQTNYQPAEFNTGRLKHISLPQCPNKEARASFESALTGVFVTLTIPELRSEAQPFATGIVKHITTVAVVQQCCSANLLKQPARAVMDVHVLLDAIAKCMASEESELNKVGGLALGIVVETAATIVGDREKACGLPLFEVAVDKLCSCCYERAWFAKNGGSIAIGFLVEKMPLKWVLSHQLCFLMALLFVLLDLTGEVSAGTITRAKSLIDKLLVRCNTPLTDDLKSSLASIQEKSFHQVTRHLVKEVISPNENVRNQSHKSLEQLSELTQRSVTEIMEPHREILADMIPPKKHLLKHQPVSTQIALMDGNTFCTSLSPRLFSIDLSINEHKIFFTELLALCESEDSQLSKLPCYRSVPSLIPLKVSGLSALAACHYLEDQRERVFQVLYKAINSSVKELQEAGKSAMKKFMTEHTQSDIELVHSALRPLLMMLGDYRNLNPALLQRLTHMVSLFPTSFNEKMCDSLLAHLRRWIDVLISTVSQTGRRGDEVAVCLHIMEMMYMLPAATFRLLEPLLVLMVKAEKALGIELGSPFREPVMKFALKFPKQTVEFFLSHLAESSISSLLHFFLEQKDGAPLRDTLAAAPDKIITYAFPDLPATTEQTVAKLHELYYQGLFICNLLIEEKPDLIANKPDIVDHLRKLWASDSFHVRVSSDSVPLEHWQQSSMCLSLLLQHCKHHPEDVETLFLLLRAFLERHISTNHLLYSYLESTVATTYTITQRRAIFFKFVEVFGRHDYSQEHKAKILQYILIPMFSSTFEDGSKTDELLGGAPDPEHDSDENIISVFINKVINPEKPFASSDSVCILLLQFSSLLVENAYAHIHDSNNKKQGAKLRRLMTFAWPCLLPKQCVDPATKYHGHLLLAHIIARFAIHKRIVLQVFHSLLKAHALEARSIVRQALDILTPVVPVRMEDANATLVHWTKKIIVEEGHTVAQLTHMLQLLCRHYKVYFPVRQHLVQHMVSSIQRLGLTANATAEQKKLAVDLAEVIIKWEFQRLKEQQDHEGEPMDQEPAVKEHAPLLSSSSALSLKRSASDGSAESKRGSRSQQTVSDPHWALDRQHSDAVINFLIRIACQVSDSQSQTPPGALASTGEILSKRCVSLVKTTLKPDIWPHIDIKLPWFIKLFEGLSTIDPASPAAMSLYYNVCTALDLLTFLLSVLPRPTLLAGFKNLNKGFNICMTCGNTKVVRYLIVLLTRLMAMFPTEPASAALASKLEELEPLYASVVRIVNEGLANFEKSSSMNTVALHCVLMILKAACNNDPCYIDRFQTIFLKVIHKLHKEHISSTTAAADMQAVSELLQLSLELMKGRVTSMPQEARKGFFTILTSLIEKSTDVKVLKTLTRIVDEWVRSRHEVPLYSIPSLREISLLVSRMMLYFEKRFPEDMDLLAQFLEIVLYIYKSDSLGQTELTAKLEPAFLCGLRCSDVQLRGRFFEVYNHSIQKRLFDRLLYIMCSQNWEHCGGYFWINHCLELILAVAALDQPIHCTTTTPQLPSIASVGPAQTSLTRDVPEPPAISSQLPEELMEGGMDTDRGDGGGMGALSKLSSKLSQFLSELKSVKSGQYLMSLAQLCYADTALAYEVWVKLFPRLWTCLSDHQRQALSGEVSPFMCSGAHVTQLDSHPSAIGAFLEGVLDCNPQPPVRSCVLKYLAKTHNFWHGSALLLEDRAASSGELNTESVAREPPAYDGNYSDQLLDPFKQETLDSLSDLYMSLNEEDMWAGLWTLRCKFPHTATAIAFESQGLFEQAQEAYEGAIKQAKDLHNLAAAPPSVLSEYRVWEEHWCHCAQELGQWDTLNDFGKSQSGANPFLVLENAWRVQDWVAMKESSTQAEPICSEAYSAKLNLLRGFLALCYPDEQRLSAVEKLIEAASIQSIKQWRRLPRVVARVHVPLLQLSQQIMELQEAHTVHNGLQMGGLTRQNFHTDVKTIFKTWKNRLPNCSDDLSHWSDIFCWRQLHYKHLVKAYESSSNAEQSNHAMVIVHHSATAIIQYAKIARKQHLHSVCLDFLSKIHSIPSVPVLDCFQKIRQQVKCYIQMSGAMESSELQDALEVIESTNLKYFTKEMIAEFMALKGSFLAHIGRSEDANKSFSAAVQLHDSLVKAWALWGDYLDQLFANERNLTLGASALTCYLHACRNQSEAKCRKYLARIIWMLTYDDEKGTLAETVDKYYIGISPVLWLPWIPQLLTCLVRKEGSHILNLLCSVGKAYPQAVYFPIRTLYLTLKMEQREKHKADQQSKASTPTTTAERPLPTVPTSTHPTSTPHPSEQDESVSGSQLHPEPMDTSTSAALATPGSQGVKVPSGASGSDSSLAKQLNQVQLLQAKISAITSQLQLQQQKTGTGAAASVASTSQSQEQPSSGAAPSGPSSQTPGESVPIRAPASLWRCSRIMHLLRDLHPTLLSALEGIVDQMVWFRENWYEELLRQLNEGLVMCQSAAFSSRADVANAQIQPDMSQFVRRLVSTFGISLEQTGVGSSGTGGGGGGGPLSHETLAKRAQAAAQDPAFQRLKAQFAADFDFSAPGAKRLHTLMAKLKRWIKILELKTKSLQKSFLLEDRCRFLSNFSLATADMDIPGEYLMPKTMPYYVRIARFMPRVEIVQRHHSTLRRLYIQGDNGKVYPYLVVNDTQVSRCRSEERVLQLLAMVNLCLDKSKETSHRYLQFSVPRVVAVAPQMRLVEDNTSNVSLSDIFKQYCNSTNQEWDVVIVQYYERLAQLQGQGETITPETMHALFSQIQTSYAPQTLFRDWVEKSYTNPTDFWAFRMQFTNHLALCGMAEFAFHLTRLEPDLLHIARNTGCLTQAFLAFDINKKGELDANRPVPFRLTPGIQNLISPIGIAGPLHMSMVAIARCLVQVHHSLPSIIQAVLRDQFIAWQKKQEEAQSNSLVSTADVDNETIITLVTEAVTSILNRLHNLAEFEDGTSKVSTLISEAASVRNISRMDPAWNPWL